MQRFMSASHGIARSELIYASVEGFIDETLG